LTFKSLLTTLVERNEGRASVYGIDVIADPDRVRRAIGVVAQGSGVDVQATGRENLYLQGRIYGIRGRALEQRSAALLERFGLAEAGDRIARGYSGGMQRRLDIAMALIHEPQVLFLDEPTTGLDPEVRAQMWHEISALAEEHGITVLLGEYNGAVNRALGAMGEVRDVVLEGRVLRARSNDGGRAVPAVLQALEAQDIAVASVRVARPSLDDVYLRYTRRTFDAAEAQAAEETR
jgi:ABC-2 type transport system ATP-binding protein